MLSKKRIILSKTNRIGDVIIALPVAAALKKAAPDCHITMLVTRYTAPLVKYFSAVDECIAWDDPIVQDNPVDMFLKQRADIIIYLRGNKHIALAAKRANIPLRIGAASRLYNWLSCNKLIYVNRGRHSRFHDAQLDMKFILPFILQRMPSCEEIARTLHLDVINTNCSALQYLSGDRFNLIIQPKSLTDAGKREWSLDHFAQVIAQLDRTRFKIFISGTESDGQAVRKLLCDPFPFVTDLTGRLSLDELICFIQNADGLFGGSTGPLHIAAAFGLHALGLYTNTPGHHPLRWAPLGAKAEYLVSPNINCATCNKRQACSCINDIKPHQVIARLETWAKK